MKKIMKLIDTTNDNIIGDKIEIAESFWSKTVGLLNRKKLKKDEGLLLKKTRSIHSIGMKFNFDAIYLDKDFKIVEIHHNIKPNKVLPIVFNAKHTLEVAANTAKELGLKKGNFLKIDKD